MGQLDDLLTWHRVDPPDSRERVRNEQVQSQYQGNRNPFIDHPQLVQLLFGEQYGEIFGSCPEEPDGENKGEISANGEIN